MANSPFLGIPLLATGQNAKEATINGMTDALERAMNDGKTLNFAGGSLTLPMIDLQRYFQFKIAGAASGSQLTISPIKRLFVIDNVGNGNTLLVTCGTGSIVVPATGIVMLYCNGVSIISIADSTIMGAGAGGVTAFLGLNDVPNSYSSSALKVLRVNAAMTAVEFFTAKVSDLDTDLTGIANGFVLTWNAVTSKWEAKDPLADAEAFDNPYWKRAVDVATTANIALIADTQPGDIIDAIPLADGMSILVAFQTDASENGIYELDGSTLVRRADANTIGSMPAGAVVRVTQGFQNGGKEFTVTLPWVGPGTDVEFEREADSSTLLGLDDVADTVPSDRQILSWDTTAGGAKFIDNLIPLIAGQATKVLAVKVDGTGTEWINAAAASYPPLTGNALKVLRVKSDLSDVEWGQGLPALTGAAGKMLVVDTGEAGVSWVPVPAQSPLISMVTKTGNYTLVLTDLNYYIRMNSASALTLTIPLYVTEAFEIGSQVVVRQVGAGQVTLAGAVGVTINSSETLKLRKAGSTATLIKVATNVWDLTGDLEAL